MATKNPTGRIWPAQVFEHPLMLLKEEHLYYGFVKKGRGGKLIGWKGPKPEVGDVVVTDDEKQISYKVNHVHETHQPDYLWWATCTVVKQDSVLVLPLPKSRRQA